MLVTSALAIPAWARARTSSTSQSGSVTRRIAHKQANERRHRRRQVPVRPGPAAGNRPREREQACRPQNRDECGRAAPGSCVSG